MYDNNGHIAHSGSRFVAGSAYSWISSPTLLGVSPPFYPIRVMPQRGLRDCEHHQRLLATEQSTHELGTEYITTADSVHVFYVPTFLGSNIQYTTTTSALHFRYFQNTPKHPDQRYSQPQLSETALLLPRPARETRHPPHYAS